jgi:hypothetical protein
MQYLRRERERKRMKEKKKKIVVQNEAHDQLKAKQPMKKENGSRSSI